MKKIKLFLLCSILLGLLAIWMPNTNAYAQTTINITTTAPHITTTAPPFTCWGIAAYGGPTEFLAAGGMGTFNVSAIPPEANCPCTLYMNSDRSWVIVPTEIPCGSFDVTVLENTTSETRYGYISGYAEVFTDNQTIQYGFGIEIVQYGQGIVPPVSTTILSTTIGPTTTTIKISSTSTTTELTPTTTTISETTTVPQTTTVPTATTTVSETTTVPQTTTVPATIPITTTVPLPFTTTGPPTTTIFSTTSVPPMLVSLIDFEAVPGNRVVILIWSTESEIDNAGFNIYRSDAEDGEYIKINDALIPAEGSSTQGTAYEFVDRDVKNRKTYYYKLEDIDLNGKSIMHGPVSAIPRWIWGRLK